MILPKAVRDTYIENWPDALCRLSIPCKSLTLGPQDARALAGMSSWFRQTVKPAVIETFTPEFTDALAGVTDSFPEGIMPRIGFCSWKDTTAAALPSFGARGVLFTISGDSPRVGRAMAAHLSSDVPVVLHLRAWRAIPRDAEFRIFIRDRQVIGVSQYDYRASHPGIGRSADALAAVLGQFSARLMEVLHVPTVVADVWVAPAGGGGLDATLIELNPFAPQTDPCLFDWRKSGSFDGSFRYRA